MMPARAALRGSVLLLLTTVALSACGGRHRLGEYDFAGRTVAVTYFPAPMPELRTGSYDTDADDPVSAVVAAGSRIAKEVEARRARARLDSAATHLDLASRIGERALQRASRYLGARPVEDRDKADFLLEVDVESLGIDARADRAYLFVRGEAVLLDARTGEEIWDADVSGHDPLTPDGDIGSGVPSDIITAGALSSVTVEEMEGVLGRLADYAADRITRELRDGLRDVRRDRR